MSGVIFTIALVVAVVIPVLGLAHALRGRPMAEIAISHFAYFTILFLAAFPFRAWLLHEELVKAQVQYQPSAIALDDRGLAFALVASLVAWLAVYLGYRSARLGREEPKPSSQDTSLTRRSVTGLVLLMILAIATTLHLKGTNVSLDGQAYFAARAGSGPLWLLPELFVFGAIVFSALALQPLGRRQAGLWLTFMVTALAVSLWVGSELFTRRLVAAVVLALVVVPVVRFPRLWPFGALAVIGTVFGSGISELVRRVPAEMTRGHGFIDSFSTTWNSIINYNHIYFLSTSFEGIEHLHQFLQKATLSQVLLGVDHGLSWLFNMGLSLAPRAFWTSKPLVYGGMEEFRWLYPDMFEGDQALTAIPVSFVVDFSFGFGFAVALVLCFGLGRFLRVCEAALWTEGGEPALRALALFVFIWMFNLVRSGTGMGHVLLIFACVSVLMLGLRATWRAYFRLILVTFGRRAAK